MATILPAVGAERQFTIVVKVDTHIRNTVLTVLYTNDLVMVENSLDTIEQLLADDDKYKVVGFDLKYTDGHAGYDQKVAVAQLCMLHHVLIYHYCLATRPCERSARFVNNPDYMFAMVDTTTDLKVLKTSGLVCEKLVDIQGQYMVWASKQKDFLVDLSAAIIDPYYEYMKAESDKDKLVWHKAWVNKLDEEHIKYAAKDAYTSYDVHEEV